MSSPFKLLVYGSLVFLGAVLWRQGYLVMPDVHSHAALLASLLLLASGFLVGALAWHGVLRSAGVESLPRECVAGMGLSIFAKYIPGKVWMIVGRAAYLAERRELSLGALSMLSLSDQLISLWVGLVLGGLGLLAVGGSELYGGLVLAVWLVLSLVIFSPWMHRGVEALLAAVSGRRVELPTLRFGDTLRLLPWFLGYWALWCLGFYLFAVALTPESVPPVAALAFPLAATLGVIAVIAPGGLGVREGVLAASLTLSGLSLADAASLSVACRLWFLVGESSFFVAGLVADRGTGARGGASSGP